MAEKGTSHLMELQYRWTNFAEKFTRDPNLGLVSIFKKIQKSTIFKKNLAGSNVNMGPCGKTTDVRVKLVDLIAIK